MNDDSLEALLRKAGQTVVRPLLDPHLSAHVRRRWQRRKRVRVATAVGTLSVLVIAAISVRLNPTGMDRPSASKVANPSSDKSEPALSAGSPTSDEIRRLRAEIVSLEQSIQRHRELARDLASSVVRRSDSVGPTTLLDPFEVAQVEFAKTAFLLVDRAEQELRAERPDAARQLCLDVVQHFPDTLAGRTARSHLEQLSNTKGNL